MLGQELRCKTKRFILSTVFIHRHPIFVTIRDDCWKHGLIASYSFTVSCGRLMIREESRELA